MAKTVLLRHDLRDGSSHYDWMIQRTARGDDRDALLITFRVTLRIDRPGGGGDVDFLAERIGDHRAAYLSYEGEISGGRGWVSRVAEGEVEILREDEAELICRGWLGGAKGEFRGCRLADGKWGFQLVT